MAAEVARARETARWLVACPSRPEAARVALQRPLDSSFEDLSFARAPEEKQEAASAKLVNHCCFLSNDRDVIKEMIPLL